MVTKSPVKTFTRVDTIAWQFEQYFASEISNNAPGAAIVIVKDSNVVLMKPYGERKVGTGLPVDINTSFRLASVSKGFAGVLTGMLVNDSAFHLQDRIVDYLTDFRLRDSLNTNNLNIEHLMTHTTGLVPHAFDNLVEANIPLDQIIPRLQEVNICCAPGAYYGYQNVAFSIIEKIMEASVKKTYCDLIHERIFDPLGMQNASCDYTNFMANPNKAEPHLGRNGNWYPVNIEPDYYHVLPAAGVNASISDLSKWLIALLGNHEKVISKDDLMLAFEPRIKTPLRYAYTRHWKGIGDKHYGLGWRIFNFYEKSIVYHGGYVKGYRAEIAVCPEEGLGIAVVTNAPCPLINRSIPTFFSMYFDTSPENRPVQFAGPGNTTSADSLSYDTDSLKFTGNNQ